MNPEQPTRADNNKAKLITTLAILIVIVLIVVGVAALKPKPEVNTSNTVPSNPSKPTNTAPVTSTEPTQATTYKDGEYSATGSYISPGGRESITVKVTLDDGVITATSAESQASGPTAKEYQSDFIGGYKSQVIGKKIDEVSLSRVSGSSLTPKGFNDAIDQIQQEAKA